MKDLYRQMTKVGNELPGRAAMMGVPAAALGAVGALGGGIHGAISGYLANRDDPDVGNKTLATAGYGALVSGVPLALLGAYMGHGTHNFLSLPDADKESRVRAFMWRHLGADVT